jgi:hopene-associated glycosyltransferase HpnB
VSIVCGVSLVAWVYLMAAHGSFWLTGQRLPRRGRDRQEPAHWPRVTAVVPARNEAAMLPATLPGLLGQDYPGEFTVIVVDDASTDDTAAVAERAGATVIRGTGPERGWAGKVHAMATGVQALPPGTEYILFTDADIAWTASRALRNLVAASVTDNRDLVSQMALLRTRTFWERAIVPAFVYFFAQLYPFRRVNHGTRTAAAAGGCMLVRREALRRAGGLEKIKGALIDDVALGTLLKRAGARCWLGLTADIASVRPYPRLSHLWQMIARSAYTQLRYNPFLLVGTIAGLALLYVIPPAGLIAGLAANDPTTAALGGAAWALMTVSYLPMLRFYRLSPLRSLTLPLIAVGYGAMTADSARRHYASTPVAWRGERDDTMTAQERGDTMTAQEGSG